jgi:hypothetical protein
LNAYCYHEDAGDCLRDGSSQQLVARKLAAMGQFYLKPNSPLVDFKGWTTPAMRLLRRCGCPLPRTVHRGRDQQ